MHLKVVSILACIASQQVVYHKQLSFLVPPNVVNYFQEFNLIGVRRRIYCMSVFGESAP